MNSGSWRGVYKEIRRKISGRRKVTINRKSSKEDAERLNLMKKTFAGEVIGEELIREAVEAF